MANFPLKYIMTDPLFSMNNVMLYSTPWQSFSLPDLDKLELVATFLVLQVHSESPFICTKGNKWPCSRIQTVIVKRVYTYSQFLTRESPEKH